MTVLDVTLGASRLLVLRVTTASAEADAVARRAWSMPTTLYGAPLWQLPVPLAYAARLRRTQEAPSLDGFATYLGERSGGAVAVPTTVYRGDPLHDPRVMFWLDVRVHPRRASDVWPGVSLVLVEQDVRACGHPSGSLITRCHGLRALAALAQTRAAEHQGPAETKSYAFTRQLEQLRTWTTTAVERINQDTAPADPAPVTVREEATR